MSTALKIAFLSGNLPLTKSIKRLPNGTLEKSSYPNLYAVTTNQVSVHNIKELHDAIAQHGSTTACLLKGIPKRALNGGSRKHNTDRTAATQWVCFDLDSAPFSSPDEFMRAIHLDTISYVVQYSASSKIDPKDKTLSCHIFIILNKPFNPDQLKNWLYYLNHHTPALEKALSLNKCGNSLHFPLDVTTCQNDKLIYTAPPQLTGIIDPYNKKTNPRLQLITKTEQTFDVKHIALKAPNELTKLRLEKINQLRTAAGITVKIPKPKIKGEYSVQSGGTAATTVEIWDDPNSEFIRYNINGGESWKWWHHRNEWDYIHCFGVDEVFPFQDILPEIFKAHAASIREQLTTPNAKGEIQLAFREKRTAEYWKGYYTADQTFVEIFKVKSKDQLSDYLQSKGSALGPFVPEYRMIFDPQSNIIFNPAEQTVNRFSPTPLMYNIPANKKPYPIIQRILDHAVGTGPIQEHFLNWAACIIQHRIKTHTAWIMHGTQGTGKGLICNHIFRPILSDLYYLQVKAASLRHNFDGWREGKMLIMVDEADVNMLADDAELVESNFKNWVTESPTTIHRKGVDEYSIPCFNNWIIGSNKNQPMKLPANDRRYNVAQFQPQPFITSTYEIEVALPKEVPAFAQYLMTRKTCVDTAHTILDTEDRRNIIEQGITNTEELAINIATGNLDALWEHMPDEALMAAHGLADINAIMYATMMKRFITEQRSDITRDELQAIFTYCAGVSANGVGRFITFLRHQGLKLKKTRISNKTVMALRVNWNISKQKRDELAQSLTISDPKLRRVK